MVGDILCIPTTKQKPNYSAKNAIINIWNDFETIYHAYVLISQKNWN